MRYIISAILTIVVLTGCAVETEPAREIKLTVIINEDIDENRRLIENTPTLDVTATFTITPLPTGITLIPQPTTTPFVQNIRTTSDCSLRADLPTYRVVNEDTLSSIATRYNTTVTQLARLNCLGDANFIYVGMNLYVPFQPTPTGTQTVLPTDTFTPTYTSTPALYGVIGTLGISPTIEAGNPSDWTDYVIAPQTAITINWTGIEPDIYNRVLETTFFYTPDGGISEMIGVDTSLSGGMSITWTPPIGVSGTITASARTIDNGIIDSSRLHIREARESE